MKILTCKDITSQSLSDTKVAVVGYGSQGRAHACNLRDSGVDVCVGLRSTGQSAERAREDGHRVCEIAEAVRDADVIMLLLPDTVQPQVFELEITGALKDGALLLFAHGFNIHYRQIEAPEGVDVAMVAPKSPGALVRRTYTQGQGVPGLVAVHQDPTGSAWERTLAYAQAIGCTRAGVLETTFAEETETDLFGEQAVLCGGVTELVVAGFETLTKAGYQPQVAYFECLHELKLIVDLLYEGGLAKMHEFVSDTAKYGDLSRGKRVIDDRVRASMAEVLKEVQDGTFAKEWVAESKAGGNRYKELLEEDLAQPIEKVGRELRERMTWLREAQSAAAAGAS